MGLFTRGITLPKAFTPTGITPIDTPLPRQVTLPLRQYIGRPAEPSVQVGDTVQVGQVIATAPGPHALPLHATISGSISAIGETLTYTGMSLPAITITGDGADTWQNLPKPDTDIDALTVDELMARMDGAGLIATGMFPVPLGRDLMPLEQPKTHLTLDGRAVVQRIDTLMITACDAEPALGVNRFLATTDSEALPVGITALTRLTGADEIRFIIDKHTDPPARLITLATADELAALELSDRGIDIAFVPYWHLLDSKSAGDYLEVIDATTVVAMHLPAADTPPSYLDPESNLEDLILLVEETVPGVLVLTGVKEKRQIRTGG